MEFVLELISEIFVEGMIAIMKNKKISKWIHYPLFLLLCFFFLSVIFFLIFFGIMAWKKSVIASLFLFLVSFLLLGCGIWKFCQMKQKL